MQDRYVAVFSPDFDPRARGRGIGCTRVLEQAFPRLISHSTPVVQLPSITKLGTKGRAKAEMTFDLLGIVRVNPASRMNLIELGQLYHLKRPLVLSVLLLGSVGSPGSSIIDVRIIVVFPTPILPLHVRNIL